MPKDPLCSSPTTRFEVRPASFADMEMIAGFVRSSADWYREIVDESDMSEHEVDESWARKNYELRDFFVGIAKGEPVGTISIQYFGDWAYLGYIYLDVRHVGKGYGAKLIDFARGVCERAGARGMSLIAHPEADWARRAYLKYGFEIVEQSKEGVLSWQEGALRPYYEEGFQLYLYDFAKRRRARLRSQREASGTALEAAGVA